jgi:hypothetical protein
MFKTIVVAAALLAQWLNYPAPGVPRLPNGKVDLSAKPPRTRDGKPDLSGVWQTELATPEEIARRSDAASNALIVPGDDFRTWNRYFLDILADFTPENSPMRPEARRILEERIPARAASPSVRCVPQSIPRTDLMSYAPFKMIHGPAQITVLYELDNTYRQIHTDGRKLPVNPQPTWGGYSVGRWEGDTLVVDVAGFNDLGWLDSMGHPRSEKMHVQERFHRRDFGHMDVTITLDDPVMYTGPFTVKATEILLPDSDVLETVCAENEKDRSHLK